jgi:RimJ/RimL family protein N-acetyltransferase
MNSTDPTQGPAPVTAPEVRGRRVFLRPIQRADYDYLYQLYVDPESAFRWRLRGATPDPRSFESVLWEQVLVQFLIVKRDDSRPMGLVTCFAADMRSAVANIAIVIQDRYVQQGLGAEALFLFIDYVFGLWNFRKLYAETPAFNFDQFSSAAARYFAVEASLPDRHWFRGRYWDNLILAIERDGWDKVAARFRRISS